MTAGVPDETTARTRPARSGTVRRVLVALALVLLVLLVLAWPRVALWLLPRLVVVALVVVGVRALWRALRGRRPLVPLRRAWRTPTWLVAVGVVVGTLLVSGTAWLQVGGPPAPGAFYAAPADVPSEHGRLVRREEIAGLPEGYAGYRILYTTTDAAGDARVGSATVAAPAEVPDDQMPVVVLGHGTTGTARPCAPSLADDPFAQMKAAIGQVVASGAVVVTPDYAGLGTDGPSDYLVGAGEAHDLLDAVTASRELYDLRDETVVWGHSQGGHAALWAGQLAADYAPGVDVIGVAASAPATDLAPILDAVEDTAGGRVLTAYVLHAWADTYDEPSLTQDLPWLRRTLGARLADKCLTGKDAAASLAISSQMFTPVVTDEVKEGALADLLAENTPDGPSDVPVLVGQGTADTTVPRRIQDDWVAARCADGATIDYRTYAGRGHNDLVDDDSPWLRDLVEWTAARFAGDDATSTC